MLLFTPVPRFKQEASPPVNLDFDARVPIPFSIFPSSYKSDEASTSQSGEKIKVEADVKISKTKIGGREDTEERIYSYSEDRRPYRKEEHVHIHETERDRYPTRVKEDIRVFEEHNDRHPRHNEAEIRIHREGKHRNVDIDIDVRRKDHRRKSEIDIEVDRSRYVVMIRLPTASTDPIQSYQEPYQRYANAQFGSNEKFYDRTFESSRPHYQQRSSDIDIEEKRYSSTFPAAARTTEVDFEDNRYTSSAPRKDIHIHEKFTINASSTEKPDMSNSNTSSRSQDSNTITIPCHFIRVGDLLMLQGRPCQVIRISTSSATGHHRYLGVDLFSKELHEETSFVSYPSPSVVVQNMLGPVFKQYKVLDLANDGTVVAMTEDGDIKQSLQVIKQGSLFDRLGDAFDKGRGSVRVLVINDGGRELAVDYKVQHGSRL